MYTGSTESDLYRSNAALLRAIGVEVEVENESTQQTFCDMNFNPGPKIVIKPSFAMSLTELKERFVGVNKISRKSTLVLEGDTVLKDMQIDGSYRLKDMRLNGIKL